MDECILASTFYVDVHHGKRRQPTPPTSSGSCSPQPQSSSSAGEREAGSRPQFDRLDPRDTCDNHRELDLGTMVELRAGDAPHFGVVRWIGWLAEYDRTGVGVELEEELPGASNGWHCGTQLFACPEGRAVFVPFTNVKRDGRFAHGSSKSFKKDSEEQQSQVGVESSQEDFGGIECPSVVGFLTPIKVRTCYAPTLRYAFAINVETF